MASDYLHCTTSKATGPNANYKWVAKYLTGWNECPSDREPKLVWTLVTIFHIAKQICNNKEIWGFKENFLGALFVTAKISFTSILYPQFTYDLIYHIHSVTPFSSNNGYKLNSHLTCFRRPRPRDMTIIIIWCHYEFFFYDCSYLQFLPNIWNNALTCSFRHVHFCQLILILNLFPVSFCSKIWQKMI